MSGGLQVFDLFDSSGEQILHSVKRRKPSLGTGWIAMYKRAIRKLIMECPNFSTFKVYMLLASKQTFQKCVMITKTKIAEILGMSQSTVYESLNWLVLHNYIQFHKLDGNSGWLMNADVTVCGTSTKQSKAQLWDLTQRLKAAKKLDEEVSNKRKLVKTLENMIQANLQDVDFEDVEEMMKDEELNERTEPKPAKRIVQREEIQL